MGTQMAESFKCAYDEIVSLSKLVPNPKNANNHPKQQIDLLAKIIDYQGQRAPIVVSSRSGFITKGHGRLMALQKLGWSQAAVDFQDYESEAQEYADLIADNKIAELAEHDDIKMFDDIKSIPDLNLEMLGIPDFRMPEIIEPQADEDSIPEYIEPRTKLGDVYQLGRHRLMCGSATVMTDIEKLMDGNLADLSVTDPPYNVAVNDESEASLKARNRRSDGLKISNDNMSDDDFVKFLKDVFISYFSVLKEGASIYVFYADSMTVQFMQSFIDSGFHFAQNCIWNKQQFVMTRKDYHYKHEPVMYGWKKGQAHNWYTDRKQSSVWNFDRPFKNELHPTMKPIELIEYPVINSSKPGDIVLDLFGGSGSTLIASEKNDRKCFMMELDPKYCDVIVARWEKYTGKKSELING
jgi:DNA modification methylase